jgi:nucleoside-diphosphate-sugar epimerase
MEIKKVFLTGANGYIAGTIAKLLIEKGYEVAGLLRQQDLAGPLEELGIRPVIGTLEDVALIKREALAADAVINTAAVADAFFVEDILEVYEGTGKTFIHTSGSSILGGKDRGEQSDFIYTEDYALDPRIERTLWVAVNNQVLRAAKKGVRSMVIVPSMVYGLGLGLRKESIQLPLLWNISCENGAGVHIEKGENVWSNLHVEDLAELYILMMEKAAAGSYFYAENGEASLKAIAQAMSKGMGKEETLSLSLAEGIRFFKNADVVHFGLASNSRCSADKARKLLDWRPKYASIFDHIAP